MNPNRNILRNFSKTLRALLTGITRVYSHHRLTSFFRFARQSLQQLSPRCVSYTFAILFLFQHSLNVQVLYGHEIISVNQPLRGLVTKIIPPVPDPLMDPSHYSSGPILFRTLNSSRKLTELPLSPGQSPFISLKESLSGNFMAVAGHDKGLKTHIQAGYLSSLGQVFWSARIYNDRSIPFPGSGSLNGTILHFTRSQRSMQDYRDPAYFGQIQGRVFFQTEPGLSIIKGIIPELAPKPGVTGVVTAFNTFEERFKCEVYPDHDILKNLAMDCVQVWVLNFPGFEKISHFEVGDRDFILFPGPFSDVYRGVIDKTTDVQGVFQFGDIGFFREESVFKSFQHNVYIIQDAEELVNRNNDEFIPAHKGRGFLRRRS